MRNESSPGRPLSARGLRFGVVASRFNREVVEDLLHDALGCLRDLGAQEAAITVVRVPGAFEIPLAVRLLCEGRGVDAVVALGAVIKGETSHHLHLSQVVVQGLASVALETRVPVTCGVLTTESEAQAKERSRRGDPGNGGRAAALAAVEMALLARSLGR